MDSAGTCANCKRLVQLGLGPMKIGSLLCCESKENMVGMSDGSTSSSCRTPTPIGLKTLAFAAALAEPCLVTKAAPHSFAPPAQLETKVKAKRKRASPAQVAILRLFYQRNAFPDTQCRLYLAQKLGMTPRSVQIWFQNQRQHDKAAAESQQHAPPPPAQQHQLQPHQQL